MSTDKILAIIQAATIISTAGLALGLNLGAIAVKLAQMFHAKTLTDDEINAILLAAQTKAQSIKDQADADATQARLDQQK